MKDVGKSDTRPSGWTPGKIAGLIAGYVGVLAVLTYPIGFLTTTLQLMSDFGYGFSEAAYATYLMPAPVVATTIFTVLFFSLFSLTATGGWATVVWQTKARWEKFLDYADLKDWAREALSSRTARLTQRYALLVLALLIPTAELSLASTTDYFIYAGYVVLSAMGGLIGGRLMSKEIEDDERRRSQMNDVDSYRSYMMTYYERRVRLYGAIAVTWVGAVVAAVCLSGLWPSSLTKVELGSESASHEVNLLSHRDGYWHVIDHNGDVVSVPNAEAGAVRVIEKAGS